VDMKCVASDPAFHFEGLADLDPEYGYSPFTNPGATFQGEVPRQWSPEQIGKVTYFTSPDKLQTIAVGIVDRQSIDAVRNDMLKQLHDRYDMMSLVSERKPEANGKTIDISLLLDQGDQVLAGELLLQETDLGTVVLWQAAPPNWAAALSGVTEHIAQHLQPIQ